MNNRIHVHQILARIVVRALKTKINIPAIVLLVGPEVSVKQKSVIRTHVTGMEDAVLIITL